MFGEAEREIDITAPRDADGADGVMTGLVSRPEDAGRDDGEVIRRVDPMRHHHGCGKQRRQDGAVVITSGVVGMEKDATVKVNASTGGSRSEENAHVSGEGPLGSRLGPVRRAATSTPATGAVTGVDREGGETSARVVAETRQRGASGANHRDLASRGVVHRGGEMSVIGNVVPPGPQSLTNGGSIEQFREGHRIRHPSVATAGPAVERGGVGVVHAVGAVRDEYHVIAVVLDGQGRQHAVGNRDEFVTLSNPGRLVERVSLRT